MTSLELLPVHHPLLKWCTPDGVWISDEEAAWLDAASPGVQRGRSVVKRVEPARDSS